MKKLDAHHHCWQYNPQQHSWMDDSMQLLRRNFRPEDLQKSLLENEVESTVIVQVDQHVEENHFLLSLAQSNSFIKGIVGWVDLLAPDLAEQLEMWSSVPLMKGFRHIAQAEANVFLARSDIKKGVALLQTYGFSYDILIKPPQIKAALDLVAALPHQSFVIDHIAKPYIAAGEIEAWAKDMHLLSKHSNVYCKISGMVTEADWRSWTYEDLWPYMDIVAEAFGPQRLMFGSDWPVCLVAASYSEVVAAVNTWVGKLTLAEQQAIWYDNAAHFYKI